MNSKSDVIAISMSDSGYPQSLAHWFGSKKSAKRLKLVLSFYSPDGNEVSLPIASMVSYLKRDYPHVDVYFEPVLIAKDSIKYSPENFCRTIEAINPDLIAFSIMSPHWFPMEPYFELIKKALPKTPTLIGGYQAMLSQEETLANPNIDFICVGDGEYAIGNIVDHLQGKRSGPVDGMWERMSDGSIYKTEPHQIGELSSLPFPDYEVFAKEDGYHNVTSSIFGPKGKIVLPVITGRGCPYRCTYCCNTPLLDSWKTKKTFLRKYDPQEMVTELVRLRDKYEIGYFEFWDELFLSNLKFVRAFFVLYKEQVKIPFSINSRVEVMGKEFCQLAADAGCHTIWFGIESGSESYRRDRLGRKMTNDQILDAAENCKQAGINRLTFNIVGMPGETARNMKETLWLNRSIAPEHFFFFPYIPLRGTPLYDTAKELGLLKPMKNNLHYLSAVNDQHFELNMVEQPELLSQTEYSDICIEMHNFQKQNNRLEYTRDSELSDSPAKPQASAIDKQIPTNNTLTGHAPLVGKRITLQRLSGKDAEFLHSTFPNEKFWASYRLNQDRSLSVEKLRERLKREQSILPAKLGKIEWLIYRHDDPSRTPIGLTSLVNYSAVQRRAEIMIGIFEPEKRTAGAGLEAFFLVYDFAFNTAGMNKLTSLVYSKAGSAQSDTVEAGFTEEGYLRQHLWDSKNNCFLDLHENGMLEVDFRKNTRVAKLSKRLLGRDVTQKSIIRTPVIEKLDEQQRADFLQKLKKML